MNCPSYPASYTMSERPTRRRELVSSWALKGELWRVRFDPEVAREWPIRRWVARDFIRGCPDLAVVDTREGVVNYVDVLGASDPAFARAWSRYNRIDAFDGLVVYRRAATGCTDLWVAEARGR
jgi:hypothetical protein